MNQPTLPADAICAQCNHLQSRHTGRAALCPVPSANVVNAFQRHRPEVLNAIDANEIATHIPAGRERRETDPNGLDARTPGAKLDAGKARVWLCVAGFSRALGQVATVTTKGADKYTPNGWAKVANGEDRYMDAFGRHALQLGAGELIDPDTGCHHKAQMIWNLLASLELELRGQP